MPASAGGIALGMAGEFVIGLMLGLMIEICFVGLQMAGMLIAQESGLAFGQIADPSTGTQQTVLSAMYQQLGVVVFLIVGGHRALFLSVLQTFHTIPLLAAGNGQVGAELLVDALRLSGETTLRVAVPAVLTLFLLNIAMGFISRTVPQLNIATIGFSIKSLVGFLIMAISLPTALGVFTDQLESVVGWIDALAISDKLIGS
jgi:flagellar biosynthetic protein FliR